MFSFKKKQFNKLEWNLVTFYEIWPEQVIFGLRLLNINIAFFKVKFTQEKRIIIFSSKYKNENINTI